MKKNIKLFVTTVAGLLTPLAALAVNFKNPAGGFLLDRGAAGNTFPSLLLYFVELLLGIVGIISVLFIVIGGFQYITSAGNEEQAEAGKKTLTNAIIGLVIVILSYVIVVVVMNALEGKV